MVSNYDEWGDRVKKFSFNSIGSVLGVPLLSGDKVLGVLGLAYSADSGRFFRQDAVDILVQFARLATIAIENARLFSAAQRELVERKAAEVKLKQANDLLTKQIEEIKELQSVLHELSIRDPLTSAYNRRYMEEALKQEYARAQRKKYPISIIILDLDNLKDINDTYGHMTGGDQALQTLAHQLQAMCRAEDVICRYGGDEFLIILRDASAQVAYERAVKWLESVGNNKISYNNMDFKITFSAGIAEFPANGKNMEDIILAADYALYAAKDAGRNCIKIFKKAHE